MKGEIDEIKNMILQNRISCILIFINVADAKENLLGRES